MSGQYKLFGVELSPYSVKVRSWFRYKGIDHQWVIRNMDVMPEFQQYAKLPLMPLVVTPDGKGLQDSTPIIETLEATFPDPSIYPEAPELRFIADLLEEYADEWGNKPMFHYRWYYEADQLSAAQRIAESQAPSGAAPEALAQMADMIRQRMVGRLGFVGSSEATRESIENSFMNLCQLLDRHLSVRPYVLGGRPSMADFGLFCQLYECWSDPTPGAWLKAHAPQTEAWIQRMLEPMAEGDFEPWETLSETLMPVLVTEVAGRFLPWSQANAQALAAGQKEFSVTLQEGLFSQECQKYHAKSLAVIREKYQQARTDDLDSILAETGCLPYLQQA